MDSVNEAECLCGMELEAGLCPNGHDPFPIDEIERLKDAVVDAAVAWHQSGREGDDTWFDKAEVLGQAIDRLLELRTPPLKDDVLLRSWLAWAESARNNEDILDHLIADTREAMNAAR